MIWGYAIVSFGGFIVGWMNANPGAAGWLQAILVPVAIAASVWIGHLPERWRRETEERTRQERLAVAAHEALTWASLALSMRFWARTGKAGLPSEHIDQRQRRLDHIVRDGLPIEAIRLLNLIELQLPTMRNINSQLVDGVIKPKVLDAASKTFDRMRERADELARMAGMPAEDWAEPATIEDDTDV